MAIRRVSDERSDRAVRMVLWVSLALALIPIVIVLALVQPTLTRQKFGSAAAGLSSELAVARSPFSDPFVVMVSRGSSPGLTIVVGAAQAVRGAPSGPDAADGPGPGGFAGILDAARLLKRPLRCIDREAAAPSRLEEAGCIWLRPALDGAPSRRAAREGRSAAAEKGAEADEAFTLGLALAEIDLLPPPDERAPLPASLRLGSPAAPAFEAYDDATALFAASLGGASFTLSGAVDDDAFASLRPVEESGVGRYLSDDPEIHHGRLAGRAAATFAEGALGHGVWRLRPEIDLGAEYLALEKVRLDAGEAGLFLPDLDDWLFSARPSLAVEGEIAAGSGLTLTPRLRAGATWLSQTEVAAAARLLDAPASIAGLDIITPMPGAVFADVEAGMGLAASDRVELSLTYGRRFTDAFEVHAAQLELNMEF